MLHLIDPLQYNCVFAKHKPRYSQDYLAVFDDERVLLKQNALPKISDIAAEGAIDGKLIYLFSIGDESYYLYDADIEEHDDLHYQSIRAFRELSPRHLAFAGITAHHLYYWYRHNRYCGACASEFRHSENERALICPNCGYIKYPEIAIAVIVGITNGDELLLAKSSLGTYNRYGLIAGFVEIGEALEDTVRREVYEEVGLRVKNIRYYASQPWGFSRSLLAGFFVELDGTRDITLDTGELAEAVWFKREDVPTQGPIISLTATMMEAFKNRRA